MKLTTSYSYNSHNSALLNRVTPHHKEGIKQYHLALALGRKLAFHLDTEYTTKLDTV